MKQQFTVVVVPDWVSVLLKALQRPVTDLQKVDQLFGILSKEDVAVYLSCNRLFSRYVNPEFVQSFQSPDSYVSFEKQNFSETELCHFYPYGLVNSLEDYLKLLYRGDTEKYKNTTKLGFNSIYCDGTTIFLTPVPLGSSDGLESSYDLLFDTMRPFVSADYIPNLPVFGIYEKLIHAESLRLRINH
jgi:hypothetical protein